MASLLEAFLFLTCLITILLLVSSKKKISKHLPPGPRQWPAVGSLFSLNRPWHIYFTQLSKEHGPLVFLKVGAVPMVVISSGKLAMEVLKTHDLEFASRPDTAMLRQVSLQHNTIGLSPYSDKVKKLRKLAMTHLLCPAKVSLAAPIRAEKIRALVRKVAACQGDVVNLSSLVHEVSSETLLHLLFGRKTQKDPVFLENLLNHIMDEALKLKMGDVFPWLRWIDSVQDKERRLRDELIPQLKQFFASVIGEHMKQAPARDESKDFVDVLLDLKHEYCLEDIQITGVLMSLLVAGLSTSEGILDYALAELIRHPRVLTKAQEEVDKVVGKNTWIKESDLPNLPFLLAVVNETMRLHNPIPLGLPHCNRTASTIGGYYIPPNSTIFINLFALGRDESVWSNPDEFYPERFLDGSLVEAATEGFQYIPFGAGRRKCLGYVHAMKFIPLVIGKLLQGFEFEQSEEIDMSETKGGAIRLKNPLLVRASTRLQESLYDSF